MLPSKISGSCGTSVATALLYAPFAGGLATRGGISDLALRGSATVGSGAGDPVPPWALLGGFALAVLGTIPFVARGDWRRLVATTSALTLVFVALVNPWPFPWYFLTPLALAAPLPRGRAGLALRALTAGVGALTPSELRVATLAREGMTNREIAQTLFVTPKTVEVHLSNAYRKLGIPGRAELGGALAKPQRVDGL